VTEGAKRRISYRKLLTNLRKFGVDELKGRGKGSHRIWARWHHGHLRKTPVPYHRGKQLGTPMVESIRRKLGLTEADGVSGADVYR